MKTLALRLLLAVLAISCSKEETTTLEIPTHLPMKITRLPSAPIDKIVYENAGPNTPATGKPYVRITVLAKTKDVTADFSAVSGNENCPAQELKSENIIDPTARAAFDEIFNRTRIDYYPEQPVVLEKLPTSDSLKLNIYFTGAESADTVDLYDPVVYTPGVTKIINTRDDMVQFFETYVETLKANNKVKTSCP